MNSRALTEKPIRFKNRNPVPRPHRNFSAFARVPCNHEAKDNSGKTTDARQDLRVIPLRSNGQFNEPTSAGKAITERRMPRQQLQGDENRSPPVKKTVFLEEKKLVRKHKPRDKKGTEGQVSRRPLFVVKKHSVVAAKASSFYVLKRKQRVSRETSSRPKITWVLGKEMALKQAAPSCKPFAKSDVRGKRSSDKQKSVTDRKEQPLVSRKTELQYHSRIREPKQPLKIDSAPYLSLFKRNVMLAKYEIEANSKLVNTVIKKLLQEVSCLDSMFTLSILHTGSYYEKLKVCRPVEFDIMVIFEAWQVANLFKVTCPPRGEYVGYAQLGYLDWKDGYKKWKEYLTSDGKYLSPVKMRQHFFDLLRQAIKNVMREKSKEADLRQLSVEENGPAAKVVINKKIDVDVVISLEVIGWPGCANGWGASSSSNTWPTQRMVEKIKNEKRYYVVAKDANLPGDSAMAPENRINWRISFSKAEKSLLRPASDYEKKYYRIVKFIFEAHREELHPLSSYHLKTLFFHKRRRNTGKEARCDREIGTNVVRFLFELKDCVRMASLKHFFIDRLNLLSMMEQTERDKIFLSLKRILDKLVNDPSNFLASLHV